MADESLSKFRSLIAKYQSFWQNIQIAYVACLKSERWISIQTRIALCPLGFDDGIHPFEVTPTPSFTAGKISISVEQFDRLIEDIVERGRIDVGSGGSTKILFLTRIHAGLQPESNNPPSRLEFQYFTELTRDHLRPERFFAPRSEILIGSLEQGYWITDYQSLLHAGDRLRLSNLHSTDFPLS